MMQLVLFKQSSESQHMEFTLGFLKGAKGPLTYAKPALQNGRTSPNYSGAHFLALMDTNYEVFIAERPAV